MFTRFVAGVVVILFVVTAMQSYWNHQQHVEREKKIEAILTIPEARPDAWTRSMDDARTRAFCHAMAILVKGHARQYEAERIMRGICPEVKDFLNYEM